MVCVLSSTLSNVGAPSNKSDNQPSNQPICPWAHVASLMDHRVFWTWWIHHLRVAGQAADG